MRKRNIYTYKFYGTRVFGLFGYELRILDKRDCRKASLDEVQYYIDKGQKISAIKAYRAYKSEQVCGIREAKKEVEKMMK